jgi:hypothetical protein
VPRSDFELLERIARGGMRLVCRARRASLNRIVALKMIVAGELATYRSVFSTGPDPGRILFWPVGRQKLV